MEQAPLTPCVLHAGAVGGGGYGVVWRQGKLWKAHRWAAQAKHGPIPVGQVVRHKCDNRLCVNPDHLEYGTQGDNLIDRRERHRYRKLTRQDADAIKAQLPHRTLRAIAADFGVSSGMVAHIKHGRQWN